MASRYSLTVEQRPLPRIKNIQNIRQYPLEGGLCKVKQNAFTIVTYISYRLMILQATIKKRLLSDFKNITWYYLMQIKKMLIKTALKF